MGISGSSSGHIDHYCNSRVSSLEDISNSDREGVSRDLERVCTDIQNIAENLVAFNQERVLNVKASLTSTQRSGSGCGRHIEVDFIGHTNSDVLEVEGVSIDDV